MFITSVSPIHFNSLRFSNNTIRASGEDYRRFASDNIAKVVFTTTFYTMQLTNLFDRKFARHDIAEILFNLTLNTNKSINYYQG